MLRVALLESVCDMQRKKPSCSNPSTAPGPQKGQDGGHGETLPKTTGRVLRLSGARRTEEKAPRTHGRCLRVEGASACSLCGRREPGCSAQKPSGLFHRSPLPFTKRRVPWSRADTAFSFHKPFHFNSNVFDKQKNNRYRCGSEGVR